MQYRRAFLGVGLVPRGPRRIGGGHPRESQLGTSGYRAGPPAGPASSTKYAFSSVGRKLSSRSVSYMRGIIETARGNPELLLRAAPDLLETLAPLTGTEPEIVSRVCRDIVRFGGEQIGDMRSY